MFKLNVRAEDVLGWGIPAVSLAIVLTLELAASLMIANVNVRLAH